MSTQVESSQVESSQVASGQVESSQVEPSLVKWSAVEFNRVENGRDGYIKAENLLLLLQGLRFDSTRPESLRFMCQEPEDKGIKKARVTYVMSIG